MQVRPTGAALVGRTVSIQTTQWTVLELLVTMMTMIVATVKHLLHFAVGLGKIQAPQGYQMHTAATQAMGALLADRAVRS